jgi:hypothetical protein
VRLDVRSTTGDDQCDDQEVAHVGRASAAQVFLYGTASS